MLACWEWAPKRKPRRRTWSGRWQRRLEPRVQACVRWCPLLKGTGSGRRARHAIIEPHAGCLVGRQAYGRQRRRGCELQPRSPTQSGVDGPRPEPCAVGDQPPPCFCFCIAQHGSAHHIEATTRTSKRLIGCLGACCPRPALVVLAWDSPASQRASSTLHKDNNTQAPRLPA